MVEADLPGALRTLVMANERHDVEALIACFADDIVVRSPITQRVRFEGIAEVSDLFRRIFGMIGDIRVYETIGAGHSWVVFWRGSVGRHYLEEANLVRLDEAGLVKEMTVFMRPVPGLLVLGQELASSLSGRHGFVRGLAVRMLLGTMATMYRLGEPTVVALTAAGVPVPEREQ